MGCCASSSDEEEESLLKDGLLHSTAVVVDYVCPDESQLPSWVADDDADCCYGCDKKFSLINRKHHCEHLLP